MRILVAAAAAFFAVVPVASAQVCFGDDGFAGPCCTAPLPNFPVFPVLTQPGLGASLLNCNPQCVWNNTTTIAPTQVLCDYWVFNVSIIGGAVTDPTIASTGFLGKYSRTWTEFSPTGPIQVWRWLVNADVIYSFSASTPPMPCKFPFASLPPLGLPMHYFGHIDYAMHCATGQWFASMALTHLCPNEAHAPYSQYPLPVPPGTPAQTFHFVTPANFVFGGCPAPSGPIVGDAQRTSDLFPSYACKTENPIVQGSLNNVFNDCVCSTGTVNAPPAYFHQNLFATVANCGLAVPVTSAPIPGILPTGLRFLAIGTWTPSTFLPAYPGPQCVGHYLGVLNWNDICPASPAAIGFEIVTGVGHTGGWPMVPFSTTFPGASLFEAVDLHNMLSFSTFGPTIGGLFGSTRVWSFNTL